MNLNDALDVTGLIEKIFTILAIIVAGLWAYYNYFRGRVYRPRLEPLVTGKIFENDRHFQIAITSKLKNVGLSKVDIDREASGIRVYSYEVPEDVTDIEKADWHRIGTFPVFEKHGWIESAETIEDKILLSIEKGNHHSFRITLRIVGRQISWETEDILSAKASDSAVKPDI